MLLQLRKPAVVLAALLQVLPLARTLVTNPATASTFAIILRWGIGAGAVVGSVDAVSGATSVFTTPSTFSGAVGAVFSNNVTVSIGGGNQAASSDYFIVSSGAASSPALGNKQSTSIAMPPGLTFTASWVNNANTIGGIIYGTPTTAGSYPATVTCVSPGNAQLSQNITITISGSSAPTAPAITGQPAATNVVAGKNATFTVTAGGTAPLGFFWLKNGTPLADGGNVSGSATATLTLTGVAATDAGNYSVLVSNAVGTATSAAVALTVILPPAITSQPAPQTQAVGGNATFSVSASGSAPLNYFWLKNNAAIANGTKYSGVNSSALTVATVATADAGNFSVIVSNLAGSVTSAAAALIVVSSPAITTPPANVAAVAGTNVSFTVTAAGSAPLTYQWLKNGAPLTDGGNVSGSATATLNLFAVGNGDAASYSVAVSNSLGGVISPAATLTVAIPPAITSPPANATILAGSNVSFTVTASGTAPLNYQWLKNGVAISGATSATLTLASVTMADAANYTVAVANAVGSVTSSGATLIVLVPPAITAQPVNVNVAQGSTANFTVTVSGTAPLNFQWLKNGVAISGANTNVLTLAGVSTNDAANYSVIVTNIAGSITSSAALLTVLVPPTIISPPANVSVVAGSPASFTVIANGTAPLNYQWLKNGVAISGATSATLTLASVTTADAASYSVSIGNSAGSVTSGNAVLTVQLPPSIVTQPANQFGAFGSPVTLSVTAAGTGPLAYQWFKAGVALADGGNISGSATSTLTITALTTNETANYFVVVSNAFGSVTSASATISVNATPVITGQPASQYVAVGSNAVLNVTASGSGPFTYQWLKNGVKITNSKTVLGATSNSLTLLKVTTKASSTYTVVVKNTYGSATSAAAKLSVLTPPKITSALRLMFSPRLAVSQPGGQARAGTNITLTITATGSPPLTYQWFKNGVALADAGNISGSTTNVLKITALTTNDTANYSVVVSNPVGSVTNSTELTVFMPPVIVMPPASQQAVVSNSVSFSTIVSGTAPLHCQWRKFAKNILGATNFTFTIPSASTNDTASYSVVVTNFAGSVTSAVATLTVWAPPVFTLQPTNRTERSGATTIFSAAVGGTAPFTFQWFKNGVALTDGGNISGALTNVLTVANLTTNDSGIYALNVSNVAGNVTSSNATLIVRDRSGGGDGGGGSDNLRTKNSLANVVASPPLVIAQIIRNADGRVTLTASGTAGTNYILQASADLKSWTNISTNTADASGQWQTTDPNAATLSARFYRLATP
jgi:hypothetical protein